MEEAAGSPEAAVCLCCKDAAAASGTEMEARRGEAVALRKAAANTLAVARAKLVWTMGRRRGCRDLGPRRRVGRNSKGRKVTECGRRRWGSAGRRSEAKRSESSG